MTDSDEKVLYAKRDAFLFGANTAPATLDKSALEPPTNASADYRLDTLSALSDSDALYLLVQQTIESSPSIDVQGGVRTPVVLDDAQPYLLENGQPLSAIVQAITTTPSATTTLVQEPFYGL